MSIIGDKHKFGSPSSKTLRSWQKALSVSAMNHDSVLAEAQFALGSAALYCNDATLALGHFSKVESPQAAWNQVQVRTYVHTLCTSIKDSGSVVHIMIVWIL